MFYLALLKECSRRRILTFELFCDEFLFLELRDERRMLLDRHLHWSILTIQQTICPLAEVLSAHDFRFLNVTFDGLAYPIGKIPSSALTRVCWSIHLRL